MTDKTLPEVGSRWLIDGEEFTVDEVRKRGRGYTVVQNVPPHAETRYRLADFRKRAKPA